ncbi:hypothetical protein [Allokutzneria albata]|uniref:Uncharacterized protein n=1 Tax=Allokutzneria albata TaxID=211114 RepID=A0A1G9ZEJ8_ALLAB|nr:hypothetical protein [Allokutzneria albata]SDN19547.1 hypothetical protein SAMN04489726_5446 [Allokutzneria albata]
MSHEELTDMDEFAEARALLGRALGEEPTMNFHPTSVLAAAKRSVARGRAWAAGGIAAGVVVIGIGGAALASPFSASEVPPAGGVPTTSAPPTSTITVSPTGTSRPTIPVTPSATTRPTSPVTSTQTTTSPGRPEPTTSRPVPTTSLPTTSRPATDTPPPTR